MTMSVTVLLAVLFGLPVTPQSIQVFRDTACHVAFRHPGDWVVRPDTSASTASCSWVVQPIARDSLLIETDSVDLHTVYLQVIPGSPEAAGKRAGFERRGDDWVILGRMDAETPGVGYSRADLTGVTGFAAAGCYRLDGGYAGACDSPVALVGTAARSVAIRGGPRSEEIVDLIVATLEIRE